MKHADLLGMVFLWTDPYIHGMHVYIQKWGLHRWHCLLKGFPHQILISLYVKWLWWQIIFWVTPSLGLSAGLRYAGIFHLLLIHIDWCLLLGFSNGPILSLCLGEDRLCMPRGIQAPVTYHTKTSPQPKSHPIFQAEKFPGIPSGNKSPIL